MRHRPTFPWIAVLLGLLAVPAIGRDEPTPTKQEPPIDGFRQLLPRGAIPALVDPEFVAAEDAQIPDDSTPSGTSGV